jgi:hypothetical protein
MNNNNILSVKNMSITGDVSVNNVQVITTNLNSITSPNTLINMNIPLLHTNDYSTINSTDYINYTTRVSITNLNTLTTSTTVPYTTTNILLSSGIYIFTYSYMIQQNIVNNNWINNLEEYIYNTVNSVSSVIIQNSIYHKLDNNYGFGYRYNTTTWHVLTNPVNSLTLNFKLTNVTGVASLSITDIFLTATRIA